MKYDYILWQCRVFNIYTKNKYSFNLAYHVHHCDISLWLLQINLKNKTSEFFLNGTLYYRGKLSTLIGRIYAHFSYIVFRLKGI